MIGAQTLVRLVTSSMYQKKSKPGAFLTVGFNGYLCLLKYEIGYSVGADESQANS